MGPFMVSGLFVHFFPDLASDFPLLGIRKRDRKFKPTVYSLFAQKNLIVFGLLAVSCGVLINYKTIWQYISTGLIDVPWVYVVTGAFFVLAGLQAVALGVLRRILSTLRQVKEVPNTSTR